MTSSLDSLENDPRIALVQLGNGYALKKIESDEVNEVLRLLAAKHGATKIQELLSMNVNLKGKFSLNPPPSGKTP